MSSTSDSQDAPGAPPIYQIRLQGHLNPRLGAWFGELAVTQVENGETLLTGPVVDQAALHGVLKKIRDLGLPLLAVSRLPADDT